MAFEEGNFLFSINLYKGNKCGYFCGTSNQPFEVEDEAAETFINNKRTFYVI
jgi:hypothetical protein